MFVLANMWFQTLMRQFFFNIDKIVFNFISTIYDFLITIARTSVLSQADIMDMADRIYKLLAIFMIFKVTFSLIMYVVNPDDFSDKNKGVSKLGTNIVISLTLLILTPYIFSYAYQLQTIILEDNSLSALIFGDEQENSVESPFESAGDSMAYITMAPFFTPNAAIDELYECAQLTTRDSNGNVVFNEACSGLNSNYESTNDSESMYALINDRFTEQTLKNYVAGVSKGNLGLMFRQDMAVATNEDNTEYIIEYKYLFSTVLGIIIILLLVTFCMDVALRSIKLAFLQLVAPIPIISYVDPKSGKDGMFKKWVDMCVKTYISLFIRLLAIYFAAYIISRIDKMVDIIDGSYVSNLLVKIVIIIGALMFAKQLPKILEGLGIKLDGGFTLNPLKKMENEMLGGKAVSKTGKAIGKRAGGLAKGVGAGLLVGGASAITGHGFRGFGKAVSGGWKGEKFGKNFSNSYAAAKTRHKQVAEMRSNGVDPGEVRRENVRNFFGGTTRAERVKQVADKSKAIQTKFDAIKNQAVACDSNDNSYKYVRDANGNLVKQETKSAKTISKELDEMKKTQIDRNSFRDIAGKTSQQKFDEAVNEKNTQITELENRKRNYQDKSSKINMEAAEIKNKQANLKREDFGSDNEYYQAQAAFTQRLAVLEEQRKSYDVAAVEKEINATKAERDSLTVDSFEADEAKTADQQYAEAITQQRLAIKEKEAELEARINDLVNGKIMYIDGDGNEQVGTGVESADKVIVDSMEAMRQLIDDVNETGKKLIGDEFKGLNEKEIFETKEYEFDVVKAMKQSKGTAAQASSGEMSHIQDVAQYTKKDK